MGAVMTPKPFENHHENHHYDRTQLVDNETLWVLAFAAVVISSGLFALTSIAH
jgi:hypothetical protein